MLSCHHRAALCAFFPLCLGISGARAQTNTLPPLVTPFAKPWQAIAPQTGVNPFAKRPAASQLRSAQPNYASFGDVEIDESRAAGWGDLIDDKRLKKQIESLDGALDYRKGALGFYRVGFEAIGNRNDGTVRVTVNIVAQDGDRTILATGESVQRWRDGAFLYQTPAPNDRSRDDSPRDDRPGQPRPEFLKPTNLSASASPRFYRALTCAPDPDPKRDKTDDKPRSAPNPQPERKPDSKPEPRRAPDPQPERRPDPKPRRAPDPQPEHRPERPRAADPFPPDEPQRPIPPVRPPILHTPDPEPPVRSGSRAPDPNPPVRGGSSAPDPDPPLRNGGTGPDPDPPNRGGVYGDSRPPRRPNWDGPYGRYPYPYPYPYPVPYPYPYPAPFPYPYPDPTTVYGAREGAHQAFDYALVQARVDAESDFARQSFGQDRREPLAQNER